MRPHPSRKIRNPSRCPTVRGEGRGLPFWQAVGAKSRQRLPILAVVVRAPPRSSGSVRDASRHISVKYEYLLIIMRNAKLIGIRLAMREGSFLTVAARTGSKPAGSTRRTPTGNRPGTRYPPSYFPALQAAGGGNKLPVLSRSTYKYGSLLFDNSVRRRGRQTASRRFGAESATARTNRLRTPTGRRMLTGKLLTGK